VNTAAIVFPLKASGHSQPVRHLPSTLAVRDSSLVCANSRCLLGASSFVHCTCPLLRARRIRGPRYGAVLCCVLVCPLRRPGRGALAGCTKRRFDASEYRFSSIDLERGIVPQLLRVSAKRSGGSATTLKDPQASRNLVKLRKSDSRSQSEGFQIKWENHRQRQRTFLVLIIPACRAEGSTCAPTSTRCRRVVFPPAPDCSL